MPETPFEAAVRREAATAVVGLAGDISAGAEEALEDAYAAAHDAEAILLDFERVRYINSTGIALIVGLLAKARANGQPVSARGLSPHYREIFEITRLADFITIVDGAPAGPEGERAAEKGAR